MPSVIYYSFYFCFAYDKTSPPPFEFIRDIVTFDPLYISHFISSIFLHIYFPFFLFPPPHTLYFAFLFNLYSQANLRSLNYSNTGILLSIRAWHLERSPFVSKRERVKDLLKDSSLPLLLFIKLFLSNWNAVLLKMFFQLFNQLLIYAYIK